MRDEPTVAFIYHPDCGNSKNAAPAFLDFAESTEVQSLRVRIIEINVSDETNRAEGNSATGDVGLLHTMIGQVDAVPELVFYDN